MLSISIDHHLGFAAGTNACISFNRGQHLFVNHQECLLSRAFAAFGDLHDAEIDDATGFETQQSGCKERIRHRFLHAAMCGGGRRSQSRKGPAVFLAEPSIRIACHSLSPDGNVSPSLTTDKQCTPKDDVPPTIPCSPAGGVRTMGWSGCRFDGRPLDQSRDRRDEPGAAIALWYPPLHARGLNDVIEDEQLAPINDLM